MGNKRFIKGILGETGMTKIAKKDEKKKEEKVNAIREDYVENAGKKPAKHVSDEKDSKSESKEKYLKSEDKKQKGTSYAKAVSDTETKIKKVKVTKTAEEEKPDFMQLLAEVDEEKYVKCKDPKCGIIMKNRTGKGANKIKCPKCLGKMEDYIHRGQNKTAAKKEETKEKDKYTFDKYENKLPETYEKSLTDGPQRDRFEHEEFKVKTKIGNGKIIETARDYIVVQMKGSKKYLIYDWELPDWKLESPNDVNEICQYENKGLKKDEESKLVKTAKYSIVEYPEPNKSYAVYDSETGKIGKVYKTKQEAEKQIKDLEVKVKTAAEPAVEEKPAVNEDTKLVGDKPITNEVKPTQQFNQEFPGLSDGQIKAVQWMINEFKKEEKSWSAIVNEASEKFGQEQVTDDVIKQAKDTVDENIKSMTSRITATKKVEASKFKLGDYVRTMRHNHEGTIYMVHHTLKEVGENEEWFENLTPQPPEEAKKEIWYSVLTEPAGAIATNESDIEKIDGPPMDERQNPWIDEYFYVDKSKPVEDIKKEKVKSKIAEANVTDPPMPTEECAGGWELVTKADGVTKYWRCKDNPTVKVEETTVTKVAIDINLREKIVNSLKEHSEDLAGSELLDAVTVNFPEVEYKVIEQIMKEEGIPLVDEDLYSQKTAADNKEAEVEKEADDSPWALEEIDGKQVFVRKN